MWRFIWQFFNTLFRLFELFYTISRGSRGMNFFDMKAFRDPRNPNFFASLQTSPQTLQPTQADEFFRLAIEHIPKLRREYGVMILNAIKAVIEDENVRFVFIHNHHLENLPYSKQFCQIPIIRIFLSFLEYDISILELHWEIISDCVPLNPFKWLTFIAQYSQFFLKSQDPYLILDILFKQDKYFSTPEILPTYVQFLINMCLKYPEFREMRLQHCWHQITSFLGIHTTIESLIVCYDALCTIAPLYEGRKCPLHKLMQSVCSHLTHKTLQNHVLALLSLKKFVISEIADYNLIDNLILLARERKEAKATLILMQIADVEEFAQLFVKDTTWLKLELPIIIDTLRLFLVVFKHPSLRSALSKSPYFVPFLLKLLSLNHNDIFKIICLIIHRIPMTEKLVRSLVNKKVVATFIQKAISKGGSAPLNAALVFVDSIVTVIIPIELVNFCDTVADLAKNNRKLSNSAALVAAKMSDNPDCLYRLKQLGMVEFFSKMKNDERAMKFLKNVQNYDCGIEDISSIE
ncbi:hypothetical protein TRFO_28315 [Tritrichomonas foetus]|uniref:DUF3447 domain-containing protein n=1 Tax=Tritrichomonas foetus TaxID=1144522 RepID=A0A1J4K387_9EUKA|nr:hypothetical protein TRFO_28315 [Tritrichomonas foetus]|eukprot:OHT04212.1 hypothetical protein TRFO_28315 [Tritrichomonas foetus]